MCFKASAVSGWDDSTSLCRTATHAVQSSQESSGKSTAFYAKLLFHPTGYMLNFTALSEQEVRRRHNAS